MSPAINNATSAFRFRPWKKAKTKPLDHVKSCFKFWKPSVARRVTIYFIFFGLILFLITSVMYIVAAKNGFMRSTGQIIQTQFSRLESSNQPDFILQYLDRAYPELNQMFQLLTSLTSGFYTISDLSIYMKSSDAADWKRIYFNDSNVLQSDPVEGAGVKKLNRRISRSFHPSEVNLIEADNSFSMFVDVTGARDFHKYFLRIDLGSQGLTGFIERQAKHFIFFLVIALVVSRLMGYFFARKIARPIEKLSESAAEVAKGDLSRLVPVTGKDEIGELAGNFNKMIEGLREWERIKVIEFELEKGRQIQKEFLPAAIPRLPDWEIATCFEPAGKVAGDFYDVFELSDGCVGLVIADVCDKGVGSALYMALFRSLIRVFAEQAAYCNGPAVDRIDQMCGGSPAGNSADNARMVRLRAVPFTNNYIAAIHGEEGMFATLFFGILCPDSGKLYYINGGHEPLCIINTAGIKTDLYPTGPAVGMMPDMRFNIRQARLDPGDVLIGYTDGVTEARSPRDEIYSRDRLRSLFVQPYQSASELLEQIKQNLFSFIDIAPRHDDVTMLAIQRARG